MTCWRGYARTLSYLPRSLPGAASILPSRTGSDRYRTPISCALAMASWRGGNAQFPVDGLGVGLDRIRANAPIAADDGVRIAGLPGIPR